MSSSRTPDDAPISVGDLVMVVRGCCDKRVGLIFTVGAIWNCDGWKCIHCGTKAYGTALESTENAVDVGGLLAWCKRIPPIGELDDVKQDEEIHA